MVDGTNEQWAKIPDHELQTFILHSGFKRYKDKLERTREFVKVCLSGCDKPYIALSSGKDSQVMAELVWEQSPKIPAVYFDADCAFPETYDLLDQYQMQGRQIIRWKCEPLLDTFKRFGGPSVDGIGNETMKTTVYRPIKDVLKNYNFDAVFVGLRADESHARNTLISFRGKSFFNKRDGVNEFLPVARWQYLDIWAYLISNNIEYNKVYDKMWGLPQRERRVSYWAGETNQQFGRWVFLKKYYPDLYNKFMGMFPEVREYI